MGNSPQTIRIMKKSIILSLIAFCFSLVCTAQIREVQLDTTYTESVNGQFFTVNLVNYTDGTYSKSTRLGKDTLSILNEQVAKIESRSNQIAQAALIVMQARQAAIEFSRMDTACIAIIGKSPMTVIMDTYSADFASGQWQISFPGTTRNVTLPKHSISKRVRLLVEGDAVAKTIRMGGEMLWITNYPIAGTLNIFYKDKNKPNLWQSIDKTIVLKRN